MQNKNVFSGILKYSIAFALASLLFNASSVTSQTQDLPSGFAKEKETASNPITSECQHGIEEIRSKRESQPPAVQGVPEFNEDDFTEKDKKVPRKFLGMRGKKDYQDFDPSSDMEGPHYFYPSQEYLDQLYEKRLPSSFLGLRGKKAPSGFLGLRGKKVPKAFLGLRGKKDLPAQNFDPFVETMYESEKRIPNRFLGLRGKKLFSNEPLVSGNHGNGRFDFDSPDDSLSLYPYYPNVGLDKRAPSKFLGLRG